MDQKIIEKLAIAEQFSHNSQYAGVARQAISDGYSSIDALFSAILMDEGIAPPHNHKNKLDAVKKSTPNIFATRKEQSGNIFSFSAGIEWDEIEEFYKEWLESRYEVFELSAGVARRRVTTTLNANHFVIRWLADKHGMGWVELLEAVARATYGYYDSKISETLGRAHDHLFSEAEAIGEQVGRRLGFKMASATNFCGADIIAGDEITRRLIEQDQDIADHAAEVYVSFCRLMEKIRSQRAELIRSENPEMNHGDAYNRATEFMLSMKAKYHGEQLTDTGAKIARMLGVVVGRFDQDGQVEV